MIAGLIALAAPLAARGEESLGNKIKGLLRHADANSASPPA
jgi:hypothetical protein